MQAAVVSAAQALGPACPVIGETGESCTIGHPASRGTTTRPMASREGLGDKPWAASKLPLLQQY